MPPYDGTNLYMMALGLRRRVFSSLLLDLRDYGATCKKHKVTGLFSAPTQPQSYLVEDGSPKGGMWTSPANETITKSCKGDIRPRGRTVRPKC